jgi:hypothetical protein
MRQVFYYQQIFNKDRLHVDSRYLVLCYKVQWRLTKLMRTGIDEGKIIFDKGEIVPNGAALHIDQGIAVTSHASQAKTVDQVIVSVPVRAFSQANEAQFYVSMSRARSALHLFTDSKVALRDAVTKPSKRLSFWELIDGAEKDRALEAELSRQRVKAQEEQQERTYER